MYALVLTAGTGLAIRLGSCGLPSPTSDDAFYRGPAAELVQHGRLAIPSIGHLVPRTSVTFACYPPLYQLSLSGWYWFFGFSLRSSLAYTYTVHLLNALAIMEVTRRVMSEDAELTALARLATIGAVGLIQVADLAYFDRFEETALLWIWVEVLWASGPGLRRALLSGMLIGLTALTSPWVGILGAMVVTCRTLLTMAGRGGDGSRLSEPPPTSVGPPYAGVPSRQGNFIGWTRACAQMSATAVLGATLVGTWVIVMEAMYPGIIHDQFFGLMRHIAGNQGPPSFRKNVGEFANTLLFDRPQLPILVLTLVLFPVLCGKGGWRRLPATLVALFLAGICGIGIIAVLRPVAYTYLGAARMLLLPCFGPAFSRYLRGTTHAIRFGLVLLFLCVAFALQQAAALLVSTWKLPLAERCDEVCHRLTTIIPPGELVDITGRYWHCFQGRNPWYEAYFIRDYTDDLLQARWLVLAQGVGTPPCIDAFELVEEIESSASLEQTYAYSLWRRRGP